jgi:hypothetical protein
LFLLALFHLTDNRDLTLLLHNATDGITTGIISGIYRGSGDVAALRPAISICNIIRLHEGNK